MILLVSANKIGEELPITGYFNTGDIASFPIGGLLDYLNDNGYTNSQIINPKKGFSKEEFKGMISMQREFASAISSLKYYPDTKENNHLRVLYIRSHPMNQDFEVPDKNYNHL